MMPSFIFCITSGDAKGNQELPYLSMVERYILLISGWAIYFVLHSVLAAEGTKNFFKIRLAGAFRYYRLVYTTISTIGLLVLLVMNASISSANLIEPSGWTRYVSLMLATVGIFILKAAFKQYSLGGFLGLNSDEGESFKAEGILKHIRHPLYAATILIALGFWLFIPNVTTLVSVSCIFLYLVIGIPLEERKLVRKLGDAYRDYRKRVPAIIPKLF
jgi:methanethiol S-methyltransferase